jgi:hypothetical protein
MLKIGTQLAIHRTDQSKLFPLIVLLQYAQAVLCLALLDFGMLCPDSDGRRHTPVWYEAKLLIATSDAMQSMH